MKIIIAGAGKVGSAIARAFYSEGHDLTIIDNDPDTIAQLFDELDVICVPGSAANPDVLSEAGAEDADLIVATTETDEINMICGISARKLGTKHVIVRIREPEYLNNADFIKDTFALSMVVTPERETAREISRILRFPGAARVDAFSKGSVEVAELRVEAGSSLDGLCLSDLTKTFDAKVLVSVVERGQEAFIPNGSFVLRDDDVLSITGESEELRKFFIKATGDVKTVRNVILMGGGRLSVYLARLLIAEKMKVTVIERDKARCNTLCELLPDARIVYGDATHSEVLYEEGIHDADAFVALSGDDGNNIITSMFVDTCGVDKIITKVSHSQYPEVIEASGLRCVVTPHEIVAQELARYVRAMGESRGSSMETLYKFADGKAEVLEYVVHDDAKCIGIALKNLMLKPNILIAAIIRGNRSIIPDGNTKILSGDHAIIASAAGKTDTIDDILA